MQSQSARAGHWLPILVVVGVLSNFASAAFAAELVVNINEATAAELAERLHGVGDVTAQRIVAYREANGPFQRVEDLVLVRGIGDGLLERNLERVVLSPPETQGAATDEKLVRTE